MDTPQILSVLNSLIAPDFPLDQAAANSLTPESLLQHMNSNPQSPQIWFQYLHGMEAYKTDLQRVCTELEQTVAQLNASLEITKSEKIAALSASRTFEKLYKEKLAEPQSEQFQKPSTPKSTKLPDPDKFGGNRDELEKFITQLQLKLQANADHFPTVNTKLSYAVSRLDGIALKQVMPRINEDTVDFTDTKTFYDFLRAAFGDPDRPATARNALLNLRQKNQDFSVFIAEFNRIAPDTGLDETSKKFALQRGLSAELQALMIHHDIPENLADYIKLLQQLDSRMRAASNFADRRAPNSRTHQPNPALYARPGLVLPTVVTPSPAAPPVTAAPSSTSSSLGPMPMDLSTTRRGPVPQAEKERRRALGLCGYCGKSGHNQFTCEQFKCYNCGKVGHGAQSCREPRRQRIQELSLIDLDQENETSSG